MWHDAVRSIILALEDKENQNITSLLAANYKLINSFATNKVESPNDLNLDYFKQIIADKEEQDLVESGRVTSKKKRGKAGSPKRKKKKVSDE